MIDNNIFISSATLIPDMYNDYNIQSDDFVSRFPIWIANALEELKFIQAYVNVEKDIEFDDHRCQLPWDFRGVIDVIFFFTFNWFTKVKQHLLSICWQLPNFTILNNLIHFVCISLHKG